MKTAREKEAELWALNESPWKKWLNGQVWALRKGEDFRCQMSTFRQLVHKRADSIGKKVITRVRDKSDTILLQAFDRPPNIFTMDPLICSAYPE